MKLYLITDSYPLGRGERTFLRPELESLCKRFSITIIVGGKYSGEFTDEKFLKENDIKVIPYAEKGDSRFPFLRYIWKALKSKVFIEEMKEIAREKKSLFARWKSSFWFVVHATQFAQWLEMRRLIEEEAIYYSYWYFANTLGLVLLKEKYPGLKIITRAHGYDLYDMRAKGGRQCAKKYMDARLDAIVFIAEAGRNYYLQRNHIERSERHVLWYLGAPAAEYDVARNLRDTIKGRMLIVSCSRVSKLKRVSRIIDAISLITDYSVTWVHFGDGELWDEMQSYAKDRLGEKKNVEYRFAGYVDRKEIYAYYEDNPVGCYLLLSSSEGLPVANMEALAHGIPIITTDVGGCVETIDHNGILLSADPTPMEVRKALDSIMDVSEDVYINMRKSSYQLWKRKFDVNRNMEGFAEYLQVKLGCNRKK